MGCMGNKGHQKVGFYGIERKGEYNVGSPNNRMYHNLGLIGVEIGCWWEAYHETNGCFMVRFKLHISTDEEHIRGVPVTGRYLQQALDGGILVDLSTVGSIYYT